MGVVGTCLADAHAWAKLGFIRSIWCRELLWKVQPDWWSLTDRRDSWIDHYRAVLEVLTSTVTVSEVCCPPILEPKLLGMTNQSMALLYALSSNLRTWRAYLQ
jgi:hypothetical protein